MTPFHYISLAISVVVSIIIISGVFLATFSFIMRERKILLIKNITGCNDEIMYGFSL